MQCADSDLCFFMLLPSLACSVGLESGYEPTEAGP